MVWRGVALRGYWAGPVHITPLCHYLPRPHPHVAWRGVAWRGVARHSREVWNVGFGTHKDEGEAALGWSLISSQRGAVGRGGGAAHWGPSER